MADIQYDAKTEKLRGRKVALVGYGNQGSAHAHNLRESGCQPRIGLRPGSSSQRIAEAEGFNVGTVEEVVEWGDIIVLLAPDQEHRSIFEQEIRQHLRPHDLLLVAHGFSVIYGEVTPPAYIDVALVAPVGPGTSLRQLYLEGSGVPALLAVHQDASGLASQIALAYAAALGCTRAGVIRTTFREETETDLFGEQAVLCGGLSGLVEAGFDTLVEAGYQPELAFFECVHQIKFLADLIHEGGLAYMRQRISDTAEFGDYTAGPRIIDSHVRESMRTALADIQKGIFARRWIQDWDDGAPELRRFRLKNQGKPVDEIGGRLHAMMTRFPDKGHQSQH